MKVGGGYEQSYGKHGVQDVALFSRLAFQARTMKTLTPDDFPEILSKGNVFIDFFAPWCPPCMRLLPEFRKASTLIGGEITFGTVDCTIHRRLCNQHGVQAYPTSTFFNGSTPHPYNGDHSASAISDFVQDILRPTVTVLTARNWNSLVGRKPENEVWLVDFYAPWCGPCRQLEPQWRALGKKLEKLPNVKIGKVDCQAESAVCSQQAVSSYPTIRMYPLGSVGVKRYAPYQQFHRDTESLHQWVLASLPSNVENITPYTFQHSVLRSTEPWLIDFYAPWCGACTKFAPDYEQIATQLKGTAKVGKINCDRYRQLCSQAGITAYPTIRFYRGSDKHEVQDYFSEDIESREPDEIVELVEEVIENSKLPGEKKTKKTASHDEL